MNGEPLSHRDLARAVLSLPFDPGDVVKQTSKEAVLAALDGYRSALIPMSRLAKAQRQEDQHALAKIIRSIGLRMRPDFSEEQAQMWIASMVEALEDQPARIALAAAKDARREPISFPGEALKVILEKAENHLVKYHRAIRNLEKLLKMIDHPPLIEASDDAKAKAVQLSDDELQALPLHMRSMGINAGFLVDEGQGRIRWASDDEQQAHRERQENERLRARVKGEP